MRIKKGFVLEKVADSYLACATGSLASEISGFVRLNSTGAFLWQKLSEEDRTESELCELLRAEYDVASDIAERDVSAFVKKLRDNGIVE